MLDFLSNKKNILSFILLNLLFLTASITINIGSNNQLSTSGAISLYLVEIFVVLLSIYVVVWELLIKRKIKEQDFLTKLLFFTTILFTVYYVISMVIRFYNGTLTAGSFSLVRAVIECNALFFCLSYFKIDGKTVLYSLVSLLLLTTIWQYINWITGLSPLRGSTPVLGISYVYAIFCNVGHVVLAYLFSQTKALKEKLLLTALFLLNLPILILTGSRSGFIVSVFIVCVALIIFNLNKGVLYILKTLIGTVLISIVAVSIVFFTGTNEEKAVAVRTISIPISIIKKVTPDSVDQFIDEKTTFDINQDKITDIQTKKVYGNSSSYLEDTSEVSKSQRDEANSKAREVIYKNPTNFLFGTGTTLIHRYGDKYQKPHNYIDQYLLSFGLVGLILCSVLFFSPLVLIFKKGKDVTLLLYLFYFPILMNAFLQPALGNMVVLFLLFIGIYATFHLNEEKPSYSRYKK